MHLISSCHLLKDRQGDITYPDNYHGITISSATSKVSEMALKQLKNVVTPDAQHFGSNWVTVVQTVLSYSRRPSTTTC